MPTVTTSDIDFPFSFWGIFRKSFSILKQGVVNYLILSVVTYIPFLVVDAFSTTYTIDLVEFFHGNFLDIIIFLTLPTIFMQNRVFPFATIQLFFQRFFASAVLISLVQFGMVVLVTMIFAQFILGAIIIGTIPYIYFMFAGFFLILENAPRTLSVRANLINSIKLVRTRFFVFLIYFLSITIIASLPFFIFFMWYMMKQPELVAFEAALRQQPENSVLLGEKLLSLVDSFNQPGFKWGRIGLHILFRPLKSLFLCFLFLGILFHLNADAVKGFLGLNDSQAEHEPDEIVSNELGDDQSDTDD